MIGALNKRLSSKSRMPPMPGNSLPESFTPASRLNSDSIRSPMTAVSSTKPENDGVQKIHAGHLPPKKCTNARLAPVETTIAPAKPSHVLPGLMRGIILCRPMSEPTA